MPAVSFCIDEDNNISELLSDLASDQEKIWQNAALSLASEEEKAVLPLIEEFRARRINNHKVGFVLKHLSSPAAKTKIVSLLADPDEAICRIAAGALMEIGDASAVPALRAALLRFPSGTTQREIARVLWKLGSSRDTAEAILTLARKYDGQDKYEFFSIVNDATGRAMLSPDERLDFLLNWSLPGRVGNPESLEIRLGSEKEDERLFDKGWFERGDAQFLIDHKTEAVPILLGNLLETGSQSAALLLGYYKESAALPALIKSFLESDYFYGWEGNRDELAYNQFPRHHCYEEAIEYITGRPVEQAVQLTEEQIEGFVQRYRRGVSGEKSTAIYVLFRLKLEIARAEICRKFKNAAPDNRYIGDRYAAAVLLKEHFLPGGLLRQSVQAMLGEPDLIVGDSHYYMCGRGEHGKNVALAITFENERIAKVDFVTVAQ